MAKTSETKKRKRSTKPPLEKKPKKPNKSKTDSKTITTTPTAKIATSSSTSPSSSSTTPTNTYPTDSDSDSSLSKSDTDKVKKLLEPYSKDQLIDFICDAAVKDSSIYAQIREMADRDVSHRKIFIHGLSWDTTRETLISSFEIYGQIEDCNVVTDRVTGKAKGYGFVVFKTRKGSEKALKQPRKKINNRIASCQLASMGPVAAPPQGSDTSKRKIYVSNVQPEVDPEKLRLLFAKFGEIEAGPIGFDMQTGKSRGFALFVYKNEENARKAIAEPYKMFDGHQLHCQMAAEGKNKAAAGAAVAARPANQSGTPPVFAAMAAAQNMMFNQHPVLNPMYGGLIAGPNGGFIPGPVNPMMAAGGFNPGMIHASQVGGLGVAPQSVLGAYGSSGQALGMQHAYPNPNAQIGQASSGRGNPTGGSYSGYPAHM